MGPDRSSNNTTPGGVGNNHGHAHAHASRSHSQLPHAHAHTQSSHPLSEPTNGGAPKIPNILPHERVFPIQIGSELFKLSGASLSSDAPSYFSQYFLCQLEQAKNAGQDPSSAIRTLYIDRDPVTFRDIALHLRGYHVSPRDGTHFVRLFADAQFYSLPKLMSQMYEESITISIGHREFQIARDLFSEPGNSPNYFSLGFAMLFSNPEDVFPGLERDGLIRPPSILPPTVPGRSAEIFADLLHMLRGYPVHVRNDAHRAALLRDCRYFNFKGLEQRLIPHALTFNQARAKDEITLRIDDILKSGISVLPDPLPVSDPLGGWVHYARPFVDEKPAELVLEIGAENSRLHFGEAGAAAAAAGVRVEFFRDARARFTRMLEVIASKLNLPPTTQPLGLLMASGGAAGQPASPGNTVLSEDWVRCILGPETSITLDGASYTGHLGGTGADEDPAEAIMLSSMMGTGQGSFASSLGPQGGNGMDSPAGMSGLSLNATRKRRRVDENGMVAGGQAGYWIVKTGQWRLRIQSAQNGRSNVECVLIGVKLDAMSGERSRNDARGFLKG